MKQSCEQYAVPPWMEKYLPLFTNTGGNDVKDLLHDDKTTAFANEVRYMLIVAQRSQYLLLTRLRERGMLDEEVNT